MIEFTCGCGAALTTEDRFAGRRMKCRACKRNVRIPGEAHVPPAVLAPARARKPEMVFSGRWQLVAGVLILLTLVMPWTELLQRPLIGATLLAADGVPFGFKAALVVLWCLGALAIWGLALPDEELQAKMSAVLGAGGLVALVAMSLAAASELPEEIWAPVKPRLLLACGAGAIVLLTLLILCPVTGRFGRRTPMVVRVLQTLAAGLVTVGGAVMVEVVLRTRFAPHVVSRLFLLAVGAGYLGAGTLGAAGGVLAHRPELSRWASRVLAAALIGAPLLAMSLSISFLSAFPLLTPVTLVYGVLLLLFSGVIRLLCLAIERSLQEAAAGPRPLKRRRRGPTGL